MSPGEGALILFGAFGVPVLPRSLTDDCRASPDVIGCVILARQAQTAATREAATTRDGRWLAALAEGKSP